ncbi:hypothetical protein [Pseudobacillus sp. 179-B 2D1 NHS]|uniref:hypothetical protein n=1 Tax=Pseudobacillus sp. 179-B 2D1 NHS TaxID=3374292 RepID=UPI00387A0F2A
MNDSNWTLLPELMDAYSGFYEHKMMERAYSFGIIVGGYGVSKLFKWEILTGNPSCIHNYI